MSLTIENLQRNNIRFDLGRSGNLALPLHVEVLTNLFLDFKGTIQDLFDLQDDDHPWKVLAHSRWERLPSGEKESINSIINGAERVQEEAQQRVEDDVDENSWNDLYRDRFLKPLHQRFAGNEKDTRITSKQKYFYDSFELHGEKDWNLFDRKKGFRNADRVNLTKPRPDRACYFTIHNTNSKSSDAAETTRKFTWKDTAQSKLVENFSLEILDRLVVFGLQACPLISYVGDSYRPKDLHCFPWLIVEHKRGGPNKERECYCQIANDSAAALMLLQTAAMFAEIKDKGSHVPPIVAVTTVGEIVRVWIAYYHSSGGKDNYDVKTIWLGNMTRVLDILKLEAILENVHSWATRTLKPLLSMYIDQWRIRFLDKDPKYRFSMSRLHSRLQDLDDGPVPEVLNLAKTLDNVMAIGFDRGRETARALGYRHLSHSTDSFHKSDNEELLEQLEKIIETKVNGLQASLANIGFLRTETSLPSSLICSGHLEQNQTQGTSEIQQLSLGSISGDITPTKVGIKSNTAPGKDLSKVPWFESTETFPSSLTTDPRGSCVADCEKAQVIASTEERSQMATTDVRGSPVLSEKGVNTETADLEKHQPENSQYSFEGQIFNFRYQPPSPSPPPPKTRFFATSRSRRSASPSLRSATQFSINASGSGGSRSDGHVPLLLPQEPGKQSSLSNAISANNNASNLSVPASANRQRSSSAGPTVSTYSQQGISNATAADLADSTDSAQDKTRIHDEEERTGRESTDNTKQKLEVQEE